MRKKISSLLGSSRTDETSEFKPLVPAYVTLKIGSHPIGVRIAGSYKFRSAIVSDRGRQQSPKPALSTRNNESTLS